jgi:peptide/nickel transport system substrate-binding protein
MSRTLKGLACLSLACLAPLGLGACGGGDDTSDDASSGGATSGSTGSTGGTIKAAYTSFPDFLDPALAYTQEGWQTLWTVYTPLLTYNHASGA